MAEYVTKEQVIDWFSPYGHFDKPIPFETLVSDLRGMKAADVEPVKRGMWGKVYKSKVTVTDGYVSSCCDMWNERRSKYCPNCGARMVEEVEHER